MFDSVIIGAGVAGSVAARELAEAGKKVLVLEKREHIGGNCYDEKDEHGILLHKYGPHIFHTKEQRAYEYLSRFTKWYEFGSTRIRRSGRSPIMCMRIFSFIIP